MSPLHKKKSDWIEYRKKNFPKLRRTHPVGLKDNGRHTRIYTCICGATISQTNRWPHPPAVIDFYNDHENCRRHGKVKPDMEIPF
jgi:hypothetical protein